MVPKQKVKQSQVQAQTVQPNAYGTLPVGRLILAWGVVGIPFAYGVIQVILKSFALFQ